jgi:hypothetical protein
MSLYFVVAYCIMKGYCTQIVLFKMSGWLNKSYFYKQLISLSTNYYIYLSYTYSTYVWFCICDKFEMQQVISPRDVITWSVLHQIVLFKMSGWLNKSYFYNKFSMICMWPHVTGKLLRSWAYILMLISAYNF